MKQSLRHFGVGLEPKAHKNTRLAIVIPCHNEPDLLGTLQNLWAAQPCGGFVEVWVVINGHRHLDEAVKAANLQSWQGALAFSDAQNRQDMALGLIFEADLPKKKAGVGLARRLGMDLAAQRLIDAGLGQIPIVGLDADCRVSANYLLELQRHFSRYPKTPGASLHYEHPLTGDLPDYQYGGIIRYELHLRLYRLGLFLAGLPYAHYTVGSSFAVRAKDYRRQGGMNSRKAGEDFYFIHKIIELGRYTEISGLTVIPESRVSDRVPFGTGRMLGQWMGGDEESGETYDHRVYREMAAFAQAVEAIYEGQPWESILSAQPAMMAYLAAQDFDGQLDEIRQNTTHFDSFKKRYFRFFNGFRAMKFGNFARAYYPDGPPGPVAREIDAWLQLQAPDYCDSAATVPDDGDLKGWLMRFRQVDRRLAAHFRS